MPGKINLTASSDWSFKIIVNIEYNGFIVLESDGHKAEALIFDNSKASATTLLT